MSGVRPITALEHAKIVAGVFEPDLDWDNPRDYDLLDRETLAASSFETLKALGRSGFYVVRKETAEDLSAEDLDDLALDELEVRPGSDEQESV